ncbi:MAG: class I SAM-dependent methyltransferase [Candidatus Cloacimonetes bacterium]|jgi:SAM-dependent methyltransferase|nr:class I SAM-dependent methyltransferase [Candidatus Cloacimonadota bacterium]
MTTDAQWWRTYFDDIFFRLHDPLFTETASRREVAAIRELLALPVDARILDVPCGWGRHTALFAEAGLRAFGADISTDLLAHAEPGRRPRSAHYAAADVRMLPYADASFDAVINVFTSLGLFLDDAEDIRALAEARRVLAPGGALLLESMHRDEVIAAYAERDRWRLPDGTEIRVRRRFDPVTGISHERWLWRSGDGREQGEKRHALRLRTATEIDGLLRAAGFRAITYYGDWDGSPLTYDAERLIAVARREDG